MTSPTLEESKHWMQIALEEANLSGKDIPVGCLVLHNGKIIARAHNQKEELNDPTGHAEIIAIRQAT
ncbi:MAG: nucleoside deaminase, partial [Cyanobacteria bacterium]|nr:nucleoside deaminase [Cyanobacteriota bacterium]